MKGQSVNGRKRSAEPRPHPPKLLNKRYWDEVRAGKVCPPNLLKEEEEGTIRRVDKQRTPGKEQHFFTKSAPRIGDKRKALEPLEMMPKQKSAHQNVANLQHFSPLPTQIHHSSLSTVPSVAARDFFPPNQPIFGPQSVGIVPIGTALSAQSQQPLFRFAPFLPPQQGDILHSPGQILTPPSTTTDGFIPTQFASSSCATTSPPIGHINNSLNMVISPLMMLQHHHQRQQQEQQRQQEQFRNSGTESTTTATWKLLEMLVKGMTPNGQQQRNEPGQQRQSYGICGGQNGATKRTEGVKHDICIASPPSLPIVGPKNVSRNSESDVQIDELMDQIAQKFEGNASQQQTQHAVGPPMETQVRDAKCRFCFVPIPMPVPVPFPVSTDFILKNFGRIDQ